MTESNIADTVPYRDPDIRRAVVREEEHEIRSRLDIDMPDPERDEHRIRGGLASGSGELQRTDTRAAPAAFKHPHIGRRRRHRDRLIADDKAAGRKREIGYTTHR